MRHRLLPAVLLLCASGLVPAAAKPAEEPDSMRFQWVQEGPAAACGPHCREWVAASGRITADTRRDFELFTQARDARGATLVLDSIGGSVGASLDLGRAIRNLGMKTAVGRTILLPETPGEGQRAKLSPRGECASMCVFVLLGGVQRSVPTEARLLVHQIWPGSKRYDANAETYTAEEVVRVQRDLGRIARYTVEMGGDISLFELAMRIPPWEHLRALTQAEARRMRLMTVETADQAPVTGDTGRESAPRPGARPTPKHGWKLEGPQNATLMRRHVLTVEGEEIGEFELSLGCAEGGRGFKLGYVDARPVSARERADRLTGVTVRAGRTQVALTVKASAIDAQVSELRSQASATISLDFFDRLRQDPANAIVVGTRTNRNVRTTIRVGGAGFAKAFGSLSTACGYGKLSHAK